MSVEQEIAAPALLARIDAVSPWQAPSRTRRLRRWSATLAEAWREGMALYVRVAMHRGRWAGGW